MKIYFLQEIVYEYFAPMYLSAMLKKEGYEVELVVPNEEKDWFAKIGDADIIAFSCMTSTHQWAIKIAKEIKETYDVPIIFGGVHPTISNDIIKEEQVDYIAIGEADKSFLKLVNRLHYNEPTNNIKGIWAKQNGKIFKNDIDDLIIDLDEIPFPDRNLYYNKFPLLRDIPTKRFITSRGCPYQCSFCNNHLYIQMYKGKGKYVRKRSVGNVIREIKNVSLVYDTKSVRFSDDTFTMDKVWLKEFLVAYKKEIDLPFSCLLVAGEIDDEVGRLLKEANCNLVYFGIECGNQNFRYKVLKKFVSNESIVETARILRKYNIKFGTYNMVGIPGETLEDVFDTIKLNIEIESDYPRCTIVHPYPNTYLYQYCVDNNFLEDTYSQDTLVNIYQSYIKMNNKKEIENLHMFFYLCCKFPRLIPLVRILIKAKPNPLYKFVFMISYAHRAMKSMDIGFMNTLKLGIKFRKIVF